MVGQGAAKPAGEPAKPASPTAEEDQSARPTVESAKPTGNADFVAGNSKSAPMTSESSGPIPTVSTDLGDSPQDFAAVVAAMVEMEVPDEEMVDYEPSPERAEMNVVYLSTDYYVIGHDQEEAAAELVFTIEEAVFKKPSRPVNHLKPLHVKGHINGVRSITCWWTAGRL